MNQTFVEHTAAQHFRFMDLPCEMRLMGMLLSTLVHEQKSFFFIDFTDRVLITVYEHLPRHIKHHTVRAIGRPVLTLVTKSVEVAILRTCRKVNSEAEAIVKKHLQNFITDGSPKVIAGPDWADEALVHILGVALSCDHKDIMSVPRTPPLN